MPRKPKPDTPPIKLHKATGQAYVNLNGRRVYLGAKYGTPEANNRHNTLVTEWKANGARPTVPKDDITVVEVIERYMAYVAEYYRHADGTQTCEVASVRYALRPVKEMFGRIPANEFKAKRLQVVRDRMVEYKWSRKQVNKQVGRVRRMFKWAVSQELVDPDVFHSLQTVAGLKRGRTSARETSKVRPVKDEHVDAIKPHVSRQVWALVQLQRITGARGGELFKMRPVDLDMSGPVWVFKCEEHKNAYRDHERRIYLGKRAQSVVRPFLAGRAVDAYLFSPRESVDEHHERRSKQRHTPMSCGNTPGSNRKRVCKKDVGDHYTRDSYRQAVDRACTKAGVPGWHPHQLRHARATELRRKYGIEAARVILGHRSPAMTELYAEADERKAVDVMRRIG